MKASLLIISLILSSFFSGTEIAFVKVNLIEAEVWIRRKLFGAKWVHYFLSQPYRYLITILIGNNVAIIAFSSLSTYYMQANWNPFVILVWNSLFLLLFGEILPKTLFREMSNHTVRKLSFPLLLFRGIFYPVFILLSWIANGFMRLLKQPKRNLSSFFTKRDLEFILREGVKKGVIEAEERKIISRVFRFSNRHVRDVLVPRLEMVCLPDYASINDAKLLFESSGYSRLPVIGKDLDDIKGVVYAKDLLYNPAVLHDIIRESMFVPKSMLCYKLLQRMKKNRITFAIVLDEYGGTTGLVTIEDIVEELFGEIIDEFDEHFKRIRRLPNGELLLSGRAEVHYVNEDNNWHLPTGNYETISGMILEHIGRIPQEGERLTIRNYKITVLKADSNRIRFVKIRPVSDLSI